MSEFIYLYYDNINIKTKNTQHIDCIIYKIETYYVL